MKQNEAVQNSGGFATKKTLLLPLAKVQNPNATPINRNQVPITEMQRIAGIDETPNPMPNTSHRQTIEAFHTWRRDLLLPGHQAGTDVPDPELVLSSKMLKVFSALHPEFNRHIVQLQLHFLEEDYTNRVKPEAWQEKLRVASRELRGD